MPVVCLPKLFLKSQANPGKSKGVPGTVFILYLVLSLLCFLPMFIFLGEPEDTGFTIVFFSVYRNNTKSKISTLYFAFISYFKSSIFRILTPPNNLCLFLHKEM